MAHAKPIIWLPQSAKLIWVGDQKMYGELTTHINVLTP
jgi:hypothetical protein